MSWFIMPMFSMDAFSFEFWVACVWIERVKIGGLVSSTLEHGVGRRKDW